VGEDERAGDERDAREDRETGEDAAADTGSQRLAGQGGDHHTCPICFIWSMIESAVGSTMSPTILPSARKTTRSAYAAAFGSWVTITIVWPNSSTALRMKCSTSAPELESRLPVG